MYHTLPGFRTFMWINELERSLYHCAIQPFYAGSFNMMPFSGIAVAQAHNISFTLHDDIFCELMHVMWWKFFCLTINICNMNTVRNRFVTTSDVHKNWWLLVKWRCLSEKARQQVVNTAESVDLRWRGFYLWFRVSTTNFAPDDDFFVLQLKEFWLQTSDE